MKIVRLLILSCTSVFFGAASAYAADNCYGENGVKFCNNTQLCSFASNGLAGKRKWTDRTAYVNEAKLRGLTCGITQAKIASPPLKMAFLKLIKEKREQVQNELKNFGFYNSSIDGLYGKGTAGGLAAYNKKYLKDADLADKANVTRLFTTILNLSNNAEFCSENVKFCNDTQLCSFASNGPAGERKWAARNAYVT